MKAPDFKSAEIKILVVDDNREMLKFLGEVVRSQGHDAFEAGNAFEALEFMEDCSFHAAIIDVVLPDTDGITLMKKLRKIDPRLAPIMITGNGDLKGAVEALNEGAEEYLLKPVNVPELQAVLAKVIDRRRVLEQTHYLEQALKQSEDRYRKSVSKIDDAIILSTGTRSRIIDANSKAQQMTGFKIQDLLKMTVFDLFPELMHEELREITKKIRRRKQDIFSHLSIRRRDQAKVPIEAHACMIECREGKLIQFIFQDISERKEIEERRWRSQRLTTFTEIASIAKDQVSSPLTTILGQTEVLKSRLKDKNSTILDSLRSIEEQVNRVQTLFDHLHDFAELQSGNDTAGKKRKIKRKRFTRTPPSETPSSRKHRILVVDDEPAMREVLADFFTMNSFDVLTSGDGEDGLKRFKEEKIDLVVTDLTMPRMDGVGLLKAIKSHTEPVPVIIMTGLNLNQIDDIAKKYGADGYIMKPFSFFQIMKLVQEVLARNCVYAVS